MKGKLKLEGVFHIEQIRDGKVINDFKIKNAIVNEGLDKILDVMFHDETKITPWYIGLIDNAGFSTLDPTDTMASHAGWSEAVPYSDATRLEWDEDAASSQSITNSTPASFTINATGTVYGVFITSDNTKSGTTGTLWSTAGFATAIPVLSGDTLKITYTVNASAV